MQLVISAEVAEKKIPSNDSVRMIDVTADAGYESEEIYTYFENSTTNCYIKPQNYERSKTKKYKSNMALRENMNYDSILDEYTCQNGKKLKATYTGTKFSTFGGSTI